MGRSRPLQELCGECRHPWSEHPGAFVDATVAGVCDECAYEAEHEGRAELCRRHAPEEAVRHLRVAFVADVAPETPGWLTLLAHARREAAEVTLDVPEADDWPTEATAAAGTLRRRAGLPRSPAAAYTSIPRLAVDDEVWAAFVVVAGRAYTATVLRSGGGWDPVLELHDEGASVVATLTPDGWAALVADLGAERVRPLQARRGWRFWRRA